MPQEKNKVVQILIEESVNIEERCDGYREELIQTVGDILQYERDHQNSGNGTQIQKNINDKCNAFGGFLHSRRTSIVAEE